MASGCSRGGRAAARAPPAACRSRSHRPHRQRFKFAARASLGGGPPDNSVVTFTQAALRRARQPPRRWRPGGGRGGGGAAVAAGVPA